MNTQTMESFDKIKSLKHADLYYDNATQSAIVSSTQNFIPFKNFQEIFGEVEQLLAKNPVKRLVFDKRSLRIFDQASMEWYYLEWKTGVKNKYKLDDHRKILPQDEMFRKSVDIGRNKIINSNKDSEIQNISIRYFENLEEAIKA